MPDTLEPPQFDDTRKALAFALNFKGETKASVMSRMMAQVSRRTRKLSKTAKHRILKQYTEGSEAYLVALRLIEQLEGRRSRRSSAGGAPPRPVGLDGAHLAGYILAHFAALDREHQMILQARVVEAFTVCECRAPCCSGWRRSVPWVGAVNAICLHLEHVGEVTRIPGKKGLSTKPALRLRIVSDYVLDRTTELMELAGVGGCSTSTAARHREWIVTYLKQEEDTAWTDLAHIFDHAGITGAFV